MIFEDSPKASTVSNPSESHTKQKLPAIKRLRIRLKVLLENNASICVDKDLSSDEFKKIFWEQQVCSYFKFQLHPAVLYTYILGGS